LPTLGRPTMPHLRLMEFLEVHFFEIWALF